jgi:Tfp pilus assembly protein PilF
MFLFFRNLMPKYLKRISTYISLLILVLSLIQCNEQKQSVEKKINSDSGTYLNHSDTAKYVGMATCRNCHQDIYNTYMQTGMGQSFDSATKEKSAAKYGKASIFYDKYSDFYYQAFWKGEELYFKEFRMQNKDTVFSRVEQVNYIVGSGHHTNSHIQSVNGYLFQMPMTFYTQKGHWDLPPGFEKGNNEHFNRALGLECLACHNAFPDFVKGSENKYSKVPEGINCERCHGPGSIHVAQRSNGSKVDTSKLIDYSIVNPAKLSIDRQFDLCQRCHLQGNAILKNDQSFFDYKPGMKLSDFWTVYLPKYKNADKDFIMASHADRLKQSKCFIESIRKVNPNDKNLKPYKNALTCVTCHNPHVSVRKTNPQIFNQTCISCHSQNKEQIICSEKPNILKSNNNDCVKCHMPVSGSTDIPHVSVHDHYIRKPLSDMEVSGIKTFIGLKAINEANPDALITASAYINQFEKFSFEPFMLDSALMWLNQSKSNDLSKSIPVWVHYYHAKQAPIQLIQYINKINLDKVLKLYINQSNYMNTHAWAAYRIGQAYQNNNDLLNAEKCYSKAVELAKYNLEFRNKYADVLVDLGKVNEATKEYTFVLNEYPKNRTALVNYGFLKLKMGDVNGAYNLYSQGLKYDPDYEQLNLNMAGLYLYQNNFEAAKQFLQKILKKNPKQETAKQILEQIQQNR